MQNRNEIGNRRSIRRNNLENNEINYYNEGNIQDRLLNSEGIISFCSFFTFLFFLINNYYSIFFKNSLFHKF